MDLDPTLIARALLTTTALAWLAACSWRIAQWQKRHVELDQHRPPRMGAGALMKTYTVANFGGLLPHAVFTAGAAVIITLAILSPYTPYLVAVVLLWHGIHGWRNTQDDHITRLREALATTIGRDTRGQPPHVAASQEEHPLHGGPLRVHIHPLPGWRHWRKDVEPDLERIVNRVMPHRDDNEWFPKSWSSTGISVWERRVEPPVAAPYPAAHELAGIPWQTIPVASDAHRQLVTVDVRIHPHGIIGGPTGSGKTTGFRDITAWTARHHIRTEAICLFGAPFAYLRGRPGYTVSIGYEACVAAVDRLHAEVLQRDADFLRTGQAFDPLFILLDETGALLARAQREGNKTLLSKFHDIADTGRKYEVYFWLGITRPDTKTIPGDMRDQFNWRVAVGPLTGDGASMMLEEHAARCKSVKEIRGRGIVWARGGQPVDCQLLDVADPADMRHPAAARHAAESLLPPVEEWPSEGQEGTTDATGEPPATLTRGARLATGSDATMTATLAPPSPPTEDPRERALRLKREGARRRRAELKVALGDPEHPKHGSPDAVNIGCRCPRVSPCPLVVEAADG